MDLQKRILAHLARNFYKPVTAASVAVELAQAEKGVEAALKDLVQSRVLDWDGEVHYFNPESDLVAGYYQAHAKGFGFIHIGGNTQYYVGPGKAKGASDGDIVLGEVVARQPGKAPMVRITEFLYRSPRLAVAEYKLSSGLGSIEAGSKRIMIPPKLAGGARDGDCVLATLSNWEGRVFAVLPKEDLGRSDLLNIAARKGIMPVFDPAVEKAAADIKETLDPQDIAGRQDLRGLEIVTVDNDGGRDLDDGFSLEHLENGNWRLGVHIADVAHYVTPGSALDREAYSRAQSVYLIDREIPMLPARLSGNLCSLLPGKDRLAVSCLVEINRQGEIVAYEFAETVISSKQQLTYAQADANQCGKWNGLVNAARELARTLKDRRNKRGAAYISLPATEISLDSQGQPIVMGPRPTSESREMIEEFMVLANELAGTYLAEKGAFLSRVNDGFNPDRGEDLKDFAARWGYQLDYPLSALALQKLLSQLAGRPEEAPISRKLARCLQKSRYSTQSRGHFNLAVEHYTHFSSPIRRYADLFTHRQVKQAIRGLSGTELEQDLLRVAEQCSFRERLAQDVEGECLGLKKLEFMRGPGDVEYTGLVVDNKGNPHVVLENTAEGAVVAGADRETLAKISPGESIPVGLHKLDFKAKQIFFALIT